MEERRAAMRWVGQKGVDEEENGKADRQEETKGG